MNINGSALYAKYTNLALNNVKFINCNYLNQDNKENPGFLELYVSNAILNNVILESNFNSSCMGVDSSKIIINNPVFQGNNGPFSAITQNRGSIEIENSIFNNFTSGYGGILNYKGDCLKIRNSQFLNSYASGSGGAIVAKYFPAYDDWEFVQSDPMLVENSLFCNVSALHDGGAIYLDLDSGSSGIAQLLNIVNSNFTDCSAGFGGAIVDLGGTLNINNSKFTNNFASHIAGAIYSSWAETNIVNSTFSNNIANLNAGVIYFNNGNLTIKSSNLTNNKLNSSNIGNIIYANDVEAQFIDSIFKNNGTIYGNFVANSKIENVSSTDIFLLNNTDYIVSVENKGIKLNFTNNSINIENLPSRFDLRDWGWASPLKYQGDNLACWAFATAGAMECALLKSTGVLYNISENNIQNLQLKYYSEGDERDNVTGFAYSGLGHALSWYGIVMAEDDSYDERGMISDVVQTENRIHLQDAMFIYGGKNNTVELVKEAIMKYGGVSIQFKPSNFNYNYNNETEQPTHFVALIGWDDSIPASKFLDDDVQPQGPGGFIIKDSEGLSVGDNGYDYLSYYDMSFLADDYLAIVPQNAAVAYIFENNIDYHVNYQTDLTGLVGFDENYTQYSNEFVSKYNELIGAVGTYFNDSGIKYSFDVYVNGVKVHTQSGVSEFAGFRTIILNKYIPIKTSNKFKLVFKSNTLPYQAYSKQHYMSNMTFVSSDGKSWTDFTLQNKTVCLKVYTVKDDSKIINNKNIAVDYAGGSYFSVKVVTADGRAVGTGAIVKFKINGKTTTVKTNANGIAKIKITLVPKKYTITTTCNGKTYKNTVTVKQVLTTSKVTVKKTAKAFTLQAKLKINGKLQKGKVIKFVFRGKTYKAKTNSKGIAKVSINKKVLKTLKKGKKYAVKVTYLKDSIKTTVYVK